MLDYQNAKIYKIVCNVTGLVYIGSTCRTLEQRLNNHTNSYNCYEVGIKKYCSSYKVLENGDFEILLLENYPCNNRTELLLRERHFTDTITCVNIKRNQGMIAEMGVSEYRKEYGKKYYKDNFDIGAFTGACTGASSNPI